MIEDGAAKDEQQNEDEVPKRSYHLEAENAETLFQTPEVGAAHATTSTTSANYGTAGTAQARSCVDEALGGFSSTSKVTFSDLLEGEDFENDAWKAGDPLALALPPGRNTVAQPYDLLSPDQRDRVLAELEKTGYFNPKLVWELHRSASTGKLYYWNPITGEALWYAPGLNKQDVARGRAPGYSGCQ
ncbi:unnamed protein product [Amoebophrya sp. A25]|nr:unnamed protein product [Amoebophrya sp. A25]|eukprot:GSA25T00026044001.1